MISKTKRLKFGSLAHQIYTLVSYYPIGATYTQIHEVMGTLPRTNEWKASPRMNVDRTIYYLRKLHLLARISRGRYTYTQHVPTIVLNGKHIAMDYDSIQLQLA
jgi:hypothetical protein